MPRLGLPTWPEIDETDIRDRAKKFIPLIKYKGVFMHVEECDPFSHAFTWAKTIRPVDGELEKYGNSFLTFHPWAAPALFKPTIAEVIVQAPSRLSWFPNTTWYFITEPHPSEEFQFYRQNYHCGITTLYTKKAVKHG